MAMDLSGKHIDVSVLFDVVRIEIHCGDEYEAQVAFDDVADTLKAGGEITIKTSAVRVTNESR